MEPKGRPIPLEREGPAGMVDWGSIRAVLFDVDGTLYDAARLKRIMMGRILLHLAGRPRDYPIVRMIKSFRAVREELAGGRFEDLEGEQYRLCAARTGAAPEQVRAVIEEWMHRRPLPFLRACRFPFVRRFWDGLDRSGVRIGVVSDYPAVEKLERLELEARVVVCATDPDVGALKPDPRGFLNAAERMGLDPSDILVIGDRMDRDGEAASRAGMSCLIKTKRPKDRGHGFVSYGALLNSLG
ncbi:MAG: HAD family hydrolase [Proteobacteria bacterium]|nr:HAD family hydrolase [Pseudomonadota bacterium]